MFDDIQQFKKSMVYIKIKKIYSETCYSQTWRGCRGRDHMVVGFTTTCAISAYRH
jgi:hypothetical protein